MLVCIDLFSYFNTLKRERFHSPPHRKISGATTGGGGVLVLEDSFVVGLNCV